MTMPPGLCAGGEAPLGDPHLAILQPRDRLGLPHAPLPSSDQLLETLHDDRTTRRESCADLVDVDGQNLAILHHQLAVDDDASDVATDDGIGGGEQRIV